MKEGEGCTGNQEKAKGKTVGKFSPTGEKLLSKGNSKSLQDLRFK